MTLHVSHITLFPYRLLQAHFTSRRDDWQIIFHVILNKMTHAVKYMVFGSHLMEEAKEFKARFKYLRLDCTYKWLDMSVTH